MSMVRDRLHRIIDELPDSELSAAQRYLEYLRDVDSVRKALEAAPIDDEPETEEEAKLAEEARVDIRAGRAMSTDELKQELGL